MGSCRILTYLLRLVNLISTPAGPFSTAPERDVETSALRPWTHRPPLELGQQAQYLVNLAGRVHPVQSNRRLPGGPDQHGYAS